MNTGTPTVSAAASVDIEAGNATQLPPGSPPAVAVRKLGDGEFALDLGFPAAADGTTPALQAGNASALPPGSAPVVALRETAPHTYALDVSWPLAADGQPGLNGTSPTLRIGDLTTLAAGQPAAANVRYLGGVSYAIDLAIPVGAAGANGVSPTLQVGNVTTLASNAAATAAVRSLGGGAYAVDLGIPVGAAGPAGAAYAGVPVLSGQKRLVIWSTDSAALASTYRVLYPGTGRTYTWSVVNPSVANALSIAGNGASGETADLSTVASGFNGVAAEGTISATLRATDDQGKTLDIAVTIVRRVPPAAGANLSTLRRVYVSSVEITASAASFDFTGNTPAGATEVDVECVGGGASGFSGRVDGTNNAYVPGHGGAPGGVKQRRLRVADVPATVNVVIGAGGASSQTNVNYSVSNEGGTTSFGNLVQAFGGRGGLHYTATDLPNPWQLLPPSDVALGRQGIANGYLGSVDAVNYPRGYGAHASASFGPGAGGAGRNEASNNTGAGGWAGLGRPETAVRGGYFDSGAGVARAGFDAPSVFGYGSGGCGAGIYPGASFLAAAGAGCVPGGGGGGGSGASSTQPGGNTYGGAGGRGAVRLHFYKFEAP